MVGSATLEVDRDVVRSGDEVVLRPSGDTTLGVGGAVSRLEARTADGWELVHHLVSPTDDALAPTWFSPDEDVVVTAVGMAGPVRVRIPPVSPGTYRIVRDYVLVVGDERQHVVATAIITVN